MRHLHHEFAARGVPPYVCRSPRKALKKSAEPFKQQEEEDISVLYHYFSFIFTRE